MWRAENDDSMDDEDPDDGENDEDDGLIEKEDGLCRLLAILGWVDFHLRRPLRDALNSVTMSSICELVTGKYEEGGVLETSSSRGCT